VPTTGARTASGGVPRTNITLPALNSSTPGVVYPGQPPPPVTLSPLSCAAATIGTRSSCRCVQLGLRAGTAFIPGFLWQHEQTTGSLCTCWSWIHTAAVTAVLVSAAQAPWACQATLQRPPRRPTTHTPSQPATQYM
jgi:hypothetical protein